MSLFFLVYSTSVSLFQSPSLCRSLPHSRFMLLFSVKFYLLLYAMPFFLVILSVFFFLVRPAFDFSSGFVNITLRLLRFLLLLLPLLVLASFSLLSWCWCVFSYHGAAVSTITLSAIFAMRFLLLIFSLLFRLLLFLAKKCKMICKILQI